MGEVIGLTINVFKHDTERFMRLFQVFCFCILVGFLLVLVNRSNFNLKR